MRSMTYDLAKSAFFPIALLGYTGPADKPFHALRNHMNVLLFVLGMHTQ